MGRETNRRQKKTWIDRSGYKQKTDKNMDREPDIDRETDVYRQIWAE